MKITIKILLLFSVLSAVMPLQEMNAQIQKESVKFKCCSSNEKNVQDPDSCTLSCRCNNNLSYTNFLSLTLPLELKFINYHSHVNIYIEEQTESIFHPPIA